MENNSVLRKMEECMQGQGSGGFDRRRVLALLAATASMATVRNALAQGGARKVLRVSAPYNPSTLDPHTGSAGSDHVILYPLYDTLVGFDPDTLQPKPALLESWSYTDPL